MDTKQTNESISYRVSLVWVIGLFLLLLFLGFFLQSYFNFKLSKDQKIEAEIKLKEFFLEVIVNMSSEYSNISLLEVKMKNLWQLPVMDNMVYFRILEPTGVIFYSTQAEEIGTKLEDFQHSAKIEHTDADFLSKKIKVVVIDYPTGNRVAQLGFTIDGVFDSRQALIKFLMSDIIFLLLIVFCYFILFRTVVRPINELTNLCNAVRQGRLITKPILSDVEEVHNMTLAFNKMIIDLNESKIKAEMYGQGLEEKVDRKTKELNQALNSVQGDKKKLEKQRLATLNILDDVSESKEELEKLNQKLEARGGELTALKNLSDDLTSVLDIEEVVVIANSYFDKFIDFSTINYLIINPGQEGGIIHNTYCKKAVSEKYIRESEKHLINFLSLQKEADFNAAVKIIKNIEPKYYGLGLDNAKKEKPIGYEYYFLSINEKNLGLIQVVHTKKRQISEDELSLVRAVVTTLSLSIDRLQTLVLAQHSKTASLVESLTDGVIMFNDNEDIVLMNPAFSAYTGFSREYFSLKDLYKLLSKHNIQKMVKKAINKGETSHINEVVLVHHFYEMFITPVRDNKDQIVGGAIIFHDITFLKEIDKMKTEFVAVASHQLRTPLTAIKLFADMMLRGETGKISKEQKEYLENVNESTERMVRLVNDLLNVSRIESGRLRVEPQEVELKDLLKNIIAEAKPLAAARQQVISFDDKGKKFPKVKLDQNLVRQVFHNLIVNAIRYSPDRTGKISIVLSKDNKKTFTVAVHDNGMGIPKNAQKRIFEKFYRADNAIKSITEGTGLGLYVSKMIVESSGGKIWFESAKGKGTSFYVRLPFKGMKEQVGERGLAIS